MSAALDPVETPGSHAAWPEPLRKFTAVAALTVVATLIAVGVLMVVRRFGGALTIDLPMWPLLGASLVATSAAQLARVAWREVRGRPQSLVAQILDYAVGWGSSAGLALLAVGCCYPGYRNTDWLAWLPLLIADQLWRQTFFDNGQPGGESAGRSASVWEEMQDDASDAEADQRAPMAAEEEEPDQQWLQQLFRVRDCDGYEVIYGTVRADFLPGQRHASVHVGFCPPLPSLPSVEAEASQWPEARVKVAQALPHGVRLDVRLSEPAEDACHVPIEMAASPSQGMEEGSRELGGLQQSS